MLPLNVFSNSFKIGNIYWFVNSQISSNEPHPHICVGIKDGTCAFLFCGTSQFEKKKRHFELNGLPFETLVRIEPSSSNYLTKETFINCNEIQTHLISDLHADSNFSFYGEITDSESFQIRNAIEISELLETDIKELILKDFPEF